MSYKFWIHLQNDLEIRKQKEKLIEKLKNIQPLQKTGWDVILDSLNTTVF